LTNTTLNNVFSLLKWFYYGALVQLMSVQWSRNILFEH